jgi:hypothetical protein
MAGLVPAIHNPAPSKCVETTIMDGRHEGGHDDLGWSMSRALRASAAPRESFLLFWTPFGIGDMIHNSRTTESRP